MKVFVILASFVAVVAASSGYGAAPTAYGAPTLAPTGHSSQFRSEDNYGNYQFGYDESHAYGGSSRREEQTNGIRRGSYSLRDADGRYRTVDYIADHTGFHANVKTNEPGVEPRDPADVLINKNGLNVVAPAYSAPTPVYPARAPVYPASAPAYSAPAPVYPAPAPAYAAPAPAYAAPAPAYAAPAPAYAAPAPAYTAPTPAYAAPAPAYAAPTPAYAAPANYTPTPRAFSYTFGSTHSAPVAYAAAPAAYAPVAAPTYGRAY